MKKIISIFLTTVLLGSCSQKVLVGKYYTKLYPDFFKFTNDSMFEYEYNFIHLKEYSSGKWLKLNSSNIITINSLIQTKKIPIVITKNFGNFDKFQTVNINFDTDTNPKNYKCAVFIDDTLYSLKNNSILSSTDIPFPAFCKEINIDNIFFRYTRCDSLHNFKIKNPVKKIFLKIVKVPYNINSNALLKEPLETEEYSLNDLKVNEFTLNISFKDSLFNYQVFKNERIKVKRRGISIFNAKTDKWQYIPKR